MKRKRYKAIVLGVSTGGVEALKTMLSGLPAGFPLPILIVAHISPESRDGLALLLDDWCSIRVKEADELEKALPGHVYLAPPNYHLLVESDGTMSFSVDSPVNFARPSVDVLFESASASFAGALIGILMTGAGNDGARGLKRIHDTGGLTIVQDPEDAQMDMMPKSALALFKPDYVVSLKETAPLLLKLLGSP